MTKIRETGPDDWSAFRAVRVAALTDSPSAFGSTLADAEQRTDTEWQNMVRTRCSSDSSAIWLAESDDGHVVGVVATDRDQSVGETELISMWVAPEARGAGLASDLIEVVVAWATARGSASVSLWVMRGNEPAQRLYESAGFLVTGDHQALPSDPCKDEIRMVRTLGSRRPDEVSGRAAGRVGTRSAAQGRSR